MSGEPQLDIHAVDDDGNTVLHFGAAAGRLNVVNEVLKSPEANINVRNKYGLTALHEAAFRGQPDAVRALLNAGADPLIKGTGEYGDGRTAYDVCSGNRTRSAFVEYLVQQAGQGDLKRLKILAESGVPLDAIDSPTTQNTALHFACWFKHVDVVRWLILKGAELNNQNKEGATPLHEAVHEKSVDCVKVLLEAGARTDIKGTTGYCANKTAMELIAEDAELTAIANAAKKSASTRREELTQNLNESIFPDAQNTSTSSAAASAQSSAVPSPVKLPKLKTAGLTGPAALLWPRPRLVAACEKKSYPLPRNTLVRIRSTTHGHNSVAYTKLEKALSALGCKVTFSASLSTSPAPVTLCVNRNLCVQPDSYRVIVDDGGIVLTGADDAGLFYAVCTFLQWLEVNHTADATPKVAKRTTSSGNLVDELADSKTPIDIPCVTIHDSPSYTRRGVMLDISRDKVPTLKTLSSIVEKLAAWKINELQLYTEHTFAYEGHKDVWTGCSPLTGEDILQLNAFCKSRFIRLVPNQNSLGHMHRWLKHDVYRELAECPEDDEPFSFCPTDERVVELFGELYDDLLPHFPDSDMLNVGLDETFDIGKGRSAERIAQEGGKQHTVYLDYLKKIHYLCAQRGRTMMFWADIMLERPELISQLPRDVVGMIWGYEAAHPFEDQCAVFARAGLAHYVCPGTSSWNSFAGRASNCIQNLRRAALAGADSGAIGYLITDWGDNGHHQPLPVSYLGLLTGAGFAWNVHSAHHDDDFGQLLSIHAFGDSTRKLGAIAVELGNMYSCSGRVEHNESPLWQLLPIGHRAYPLVQEHTDEGLLKISRRIRELVQEISTCEPRGADRIVVKEEFAWVAYMLLFAADYGRALLQSHDLKVPRDGYQTGRISYDRRMALAQMLSGLVERLHSLWRERNRIGGFGDSAHRLQCLLADLRGEARPPKPTASKAVAHAPLPSSASVDDVNAAEGRCSVM